MADTVLFDPGIGDLVDDFSEYINNVYYRLSTLKSIHQKKANFKIYFPKIVNALENTIAFYWGCLIWAYIIKNSDGEKEIVGNVFLNISEEMLEDYDFLVQINFIKNYFNSLQKDCSYYLGQKYSIPQVWSDIVESYSEFLTLNKGFVGVRTTKDLQLPQNLANYKFEEDLNFWIQKSIEEKNLKDLLLNVKFPLKA